MGASHTSHRLWRSFTLAAVAAAALLAQTPPAAPPAGQSILLSRIRVVASALFKNMPNYTCTMRIERYVRAPEKREFVLLDNVRVEVIYIKGAELFAWPGAGSFEHRDLAQMVGGGTISTGDFAGHAASILLSSGVEIQYIGQEDLEGHATYRYGFRVARAQSHYVMRVPPKEADVGYQGTFWVDHDTLEPLRIDLFIDDIPDVLPVRSATKSILYQQTRLGDGVFLLPASADMTLFNTGGSAFRNRTIFSSCHQYVGESSVTFDAPAPSEPAPAQTRAASWSLPARLEVSLRGNQPFEYPNSAVGDPVAFTVARNASTRGQVWLPKGATVEGRVVGLRCGDQPDRHCFFTVHLERFTFQSGPHETKAGPFVAELEEPKWQRVLTSSPVGRSARALQLISLEAERPQKGAGVFFFWVGRKASRPLDSVWRTLDSSGDAKP
jgi:hypothetical protein